MLSSNSMQVAPEYGIQPDAHYNPVPTFATFFIQMFENAPVSGERIVANATQSEFAYW